jgi:hypothetical protein
VMERKKMLGSGACLLSLRVSGWRGLWRECECEGALVKQSSLACVEDRRLLVFLFMTTHARDFACDSSNGVSDEPGKEKDYQGQTGKRTRREEQEQNRSQRLTANKIFHSQYFVVVCPSWHLNGRRSSIAPVLSSQW